VWALNRARIEREIMANTAAGDAGMVEGAKAAGIVLAWRWERKDENMLAMLHL
jgi:hypothetical protein